MSKCILILDDDTEILAVCRIILEQQNYRVVTRTFCDNIVADVSDIKPELIFMDLWIPTLGGEAATNLIKNNPVTNQVPVILFSANTEIEKIAARSHANGFLKKPFDIKEMMDAVKNNLAGMHNG